MANDLTPTLLDVEDRPVVVFRDLPAPRAFVWGALGWIEAPGLVGKSDVEGITLSPEDFAAQFPTADLTELHLEG